MTFHRVHDRGRRQDDARRHRHEPDSDAAKTFTIKLEFIDKAGNAVTTQDVPVGPVAPHERANFKATGTGAGIVAFRYAPLN